MCGIVGAVASRNISGILLEGLKRLEYRGYDSAGVAVIEDGKLNNCKRVGKVAALDEAMGDGRISGGTGIAHTRWATHGKPSEINAHPHYSGDKLAVVHNGIIENHNELRERLQGKGYRFVSETDTEVIAHLVNDLMQQGDDLLAAVKAAVPQLEGACRLATWSQRPEAAIWAATLAPREVIAPEMRLHAADRLVGCPLDALLRWRWDHDQSQLHWQHAA